MDHSKYDVSQVYAFKGLGLKRDSVTRFFYSGFFIKQLLLVAFNMPTKNFEFFWIFKELFIHICNRLPGVLYSPPMNKDSWVFSSPRSHDSPVYSSPGSQDSPMTNILLSPPKLVYKKPTDAKYTRQSKLPRD
jgi:hypothetical protein